MILSRILTTISPIHLLLAQPSILAQDMIDVMLLSASNLKKLATEGLFEKSHVTPAVRANDATDIVVGVLGGSAGTTRDTFELLHQAERRGARVALFGRKINLAEAPLAIVALMRQVADGAIAPAEAVRAYHAEIQKKGLKPARALKEDLTITEAVLKDG
jgi:hypothetical protein